MHGASSCLSPDWASSALAGPKGDAERLPSRCEEFGLLGLQECKTLGRNVKNGGCGNEMGREAGGERRVGW